MKTLLILTLLIVSLSATSQQNQEKDVLRNYQFTAPHKTPLQNIRGWDAENQTGKIATKNFKSLISGRQQAEYSGHRGKNYIYRLPQDKMPFILPDNSFAYIMPGTQQLEKFKQQGYTFISSILNGYKSGPILLEKPRDVEN